MDLLGHTTRVGAVFGGLLDQTSVLGQQAQAPDDMNLDQLISQASGISNQQGRAVVTKDGRNYGAIIGKTVDNDERQCYGIRFSTSFQLLNAFGCTPVDRSWLGPNFSALTNESAAGMTRIVTEATHMYEWAKIKANFIALGVTLGHGTASFGADAHAGDDVWPDVHNFAEQAENARRQDKRISDLRQECDRLKSQLTQARTTAFAREIEFKNLSDELQAVRNSVQTQSHQQRQQQQQSQQQEQPQQSRSGRQMPNGVIVGEVDDWSEAIADEFLDEDMMRPGGVFKFDEFQYTFLCDDRFALRVPPIMREFKRETGWQSLAVEALSQWCLVAKKIAYQIAPGRWKDSTLVKLGNSLLALCRLQHFGGNAAKYIADRDKLATASDDVRPNEIVRQLVMDASAGGGGGGGGGKRNGGGGGGGGKGPRKNNLELQRINNAPSQSSGGDRPGQGAASAAKKPQEPTRRST